MTPQNPKPRKPISAAEPVSDLRYIRIRDNAEPLVNFLTECPELLLAPSNFNYTRETYVREGLLQRLCLAAKSLPRHYRLMMVEGWRAPYIQRRMYLAVWQRFKERNPQWSDTQLRRVVNRFTAPLSKVVPPPHSTGGAIDVALADADGNMLDLRSPYEFGDPHGFMLRARNLLPEVLERRLILHDALANHGITNYPSEFWHYSYGDQGWAYRGSHDFAIYGATQPTGWSPRPEDNIEEPLVFNQNLLTEGTETSSN